MCQGVYRLRQLNDELGQVINAAVRFDPTGKKPTTEAWEDLKLRDRIVIGAPSASVKLWKVPELYVRQDETTSVQDWDYLFCEGMFGVFSPRAMEVLTPYFGDRFLPLPVRLDGHSYSTLHCRRRTDCLNGPKSEAEFFSFPPRVAPWIGRHVFFRERLPDPMIFAIPERPFFLHCTESIPGIVEAAQLRGFDFQLLEDEDQGSIYFPRWGV